MKRVLDWHQNSSGITAKTLSPPFNSFEEIIA